MSAKGVICPRCGRADHVDRHVEPFDGMCQLSTVCLGLVGWIDSTIDRHRWLRCGHCAHVFRPPARVLPTLLLTLVVALVVAGFTGLTVVVLESQGTIDPLDPSLVGWIAEHQAAVLAGAGAGLLVLVIALVWASVRAASWRRAAARYKRELDRHQAVASETRTPHSGH